MTLWIWDEDRNSENEEKARAALRSRGFDFDERLEICMSEPVVIDTGFEEIGIDDLDMLDRYSVVNGELCLLGMTLKEFDERMFSQHPQRQTDR